MKNLILFFGEEKLLIKEEVAKIKQKIVPKNLEAINFIPLDGKTVIEEDILKACNIVPMMSAKKLVVVYDARFFESEKTKQEDYFLNELEIIPDHTYLVFTATKADKRRKIFKMIKSKGIVREFNTPSLKDKALWVQQRIKLYGKSMDLKTAYFIAEYTADLYQTDSELRKIAAFLAEKQTVEQNNLSDIFYKSLEGNIFEMMDCIGSKKSTEAVKIINRLLEQGEKGIVILYMISKHVMNLITVKSLQGLSFQEITEKSGLHPFVIRKAIKQSENFTLDELKRSLKLCQDLDMDIKMGKIQERIGLELLVTNIS
ncbi:DNA polymerase III, delta subunit [Tepidanaerobacter acetatoxydans Re1]|uniref:DNA polymerase III subunit delta n=1 Tax=Tepidanaerobacter acetatoxydans (strain DSM 21804 / JCM 16047 / Re1) TaxID=1209989 RepID=F4LSG6_TEPAE|nr:DNA polymerase III subunit delta [Tepidanaerobacter acetatoxydans]AEE91232.1 DNA polymerase III, delta subunit [Tepidanaerobacter acetatoxydans Re1]CCP25910.2 DNA polymerase III, delta subunit [Tepidanaerobacter acetatoxydans Re1]